MDGDGDDDLDGFLLGGDESDDTTTSARPLHTGRHRRRGSSSSSSEDNKPRRKSSSSGRNVNSKARHGDKNGSDNSSPLRRKKKKKSHERQQERHHIDREQIYSTIEAVLSSSSVSGSDDDDDNVATFGKKAQKRQSRLKPKPAPHEQTPEECERYQEGAAIEARFGGRLKWFPGKISRVYEDKPTGGVMYDIEFDDGDKEDGVLAGRVRSPGQSAPTLEAGVTVDVKLARKGKGYHAGKIGRANDDGSFYVKLDDGDSEWSVPAQQLIPAYPFVPTTMTQDCGGSRSGPHSSREPASATTEESPRQSSVGVTSTPTQKVEAAETATGLSSAPPPGGQQDEQGSEERSEDNEASGVSWIAELASSVGVLPAGENPAVPAPTAEADEHSDGANGLGWIEKVVSHVEGGSVPPRGSSSPSLPPKGAPHATRSTAATAGNVSPLPNPDGGGFAAAGPTTSTPAAVGLISSTRPSASSTPPAATPISTTIPIAGGGGAGGGQRTPGATRMKQPQAQTPTHLTWKPDTDKTASRPWGAPPPDESADDTVPANSQTKQEMASPPRLSRSLRAHIPASAASDPALNPGPLGQRDPAGMVGDGGNRATVNDEPPKTTPPFPSSEVSKLQGSASGTRQPPVKRDPTKDSATAAAAAGEGEPGLGTGDFGSKRSQHPSDENTAVMGVVRDPPDARETAPVPVQGDTETAEAQKQPSGEHPKTLPPLRESVSASEQGGGGDSNTRWEVLRSSVQRRYAAEAMHRSEEVRVLAARLKAADDITQAKLAQQESQLIGQMEEMLRHERVKMQALLTEERASSARRVGALQKELDVAKRQLEVERNRTAKGAARELLRGRRARTPPPLGHAATTGWHPTPNSATRRGRCDGRSETNPRVPSNGHLPGPVEAVTSRRRSASSTAIARTAPPSSRVNKSERRYPPPPPPPPTPLRMGRASPSRGHAASAEAAASGCGGGEGLGISALVKDVFPLPPTPAEAAAGGARPYAHDGTEELSTVEDGGTCAEAATDGRHHSNQSYGEERLRWKLETERRDTRRRLEAMKGEVERVVGQFRSRAERAEAAAASAEKKATINALRYLRSKAQRGGKTDVLADSSGW